jgi:hypothetical protein
MIRGQRFDGLIRFETLEDDLEKELGRPVPLDPPYHPSANVDEYLTDDLVQVIETWARPDREAFGYVKAQKEAARAR